MTKAVQFDSYGGIDVLEVRDVPRPVPGAGEVLVEVRAAGINPSEAVIRSGALHDRWPATFPSGQGSDLAGWWPNSVPVSAVSLSAMRSSDFPTATVQPRRVRDGAGESVDTAAGRGAVGGGRFAVHGGDHRLRRGAGGAPGSGRLAISSEVCFIAVQPVGHVRDRRRDHVVRRPGRDRG